MVLILKALKSFEGAVLEGSLAIDVMVGCCVCPWKARPRTLGKVAEPWRNAFAVQSDIRELVPLE